MDFLPNDISLIVHRYIIKQNYKKVLRQMKESMEILTPQMNGYIQEYKDDHICYNKEEKLWYIWYRDWDPYDD